MLVCPRCDRHASAHARSCPFCGTALETTRATIVHVTSLALGLALVGCADKNDEAESTVTDSTTTTSSTVPGGGSSTYDDGGAEAPAYAEPGGDSWWEETDTYMPSTTTGEGTSGETTTGEASTDSTGDTDTETETEGGTGDSTG